MQFRGAFFESVEVTGPSMIPSLGENPQRFKLFSEILIQSVVTLQEREPGIKTAEELVKNALKRMAAGRG